MDSEVFIGRANEKGGIDLSDYNKARLRDFLKKNKGRLMRIEPERIESTKLRRFFEGAVIPLCTYYQENMNYHNSDNLYQMRESLKVEFNSEIVNVNGRAVKIAKSTKGKELNDFVEKVIAWMEEQGYQTELLNPKTYQHWEDTIRPFEGFENYIDYLIESGKLHP